MLYNKKYVKRMWTGQDSNLQIRACHGVLSIKLLALKNTSILTNRCSVLSKIFILKYSLTYFLFMFNMEIFKGASDGLEPSYTICSRMF